MLIIAYRNNKIFQIGRFLYYTQYSLEYISISPETRTLLTTIEANETLFSNFDLIFSLYFYNALYFIISFYGWTRRRKSWQKNPY